MCKNMMHLKKLFKPTRVLQSGAGLVGKAFSNLEQRLCCVQGRHNSRHLQSECMAHQPTRKEVLEGEGGVFLCCITQEQGTGWSTHCHSHAESVTLASNLPWKHHVETLVVAFTLLRLQSCTLCGQQAPLNIVELLQRHAPIALSVIWDWDS